MTGALNISLLSILLLTPFGIAVGQVLFKISGDRLAAENGTILSLATNPVFIAAITLYAAATVIWIFALKQVPLTYAYSFMALTFVFVPVLAYFILGEPVTLRYVMGAGLIIAGLLIVQS